MTLSEAKIYFPIDSDDLEMEDVLDLYDERLFEFKQFFLSKAIVKKVFLAKLEKLKKFEEAFSLIVQQPFIVKENLTQKTKFSDNVRSSFDLFEQRKSEFKKLITSSKNGSELNESVLNLLQLSDDYSKNWIIGSALEIEIETLSKEPDSMEILQAIRVFESQGGTTYSDILIQKNNLALMKEMKRVSLLFEKMNQ